MKLRFTDYSGQTSVLVVGLFFFLAVGTAALGAFGMGFLGKGRNQRAADLVAVSAAKKMQQDYNRLFVPAYNPDGSYNPEHMELEQYLDRARETALHYGKENGVELKKVDVSFPDGDSFAPTQVQIAVRKPIKVESPTGGKPRNLKSVSRATAQISLASGYGGEGMPTVATGGGYGGRLAYVQGKPMRPDVAQEFKRMYAAAAADGAALYINSAYRSDAEQAILFAANPNPRMVAPPGKSLHRNATELDLGPPAVYGWLAANAGRFGFIQRYSWERWHYGYTRNLRSTPSEQRSTDEGKKKSGQRDSSEGEGEIIDFGGDGEKKHAAEKSDERESKERSQGHSDGDVGVPNFVPAKYAGIIASAAQRYNFSAAVLSAQIYAESSFNPHAVSRAGAQGISQFLPGTAKAYGLKNPYDPEQAIHAQARMMRDLLNQFGSVEKALAAYNAGPFAVSRCNCIPKNGETQGYLTRINGILGGAGLGAAVVANQLEVHLIPNADSKVG